VSGTVSFRDKRGQNWTLLYAAAQNPAGPNWLVGTYRFQMGGSEAIAAKFYTFKADGTFHSGWFVSSDRGHRSATGKPIAVVKRGRNLHAA
jgi:hypothetical protein